MSDAGLFLDTGYVIALLNATDVYHDAALAWATALEQRPRPIVTTTAILAEIGDSFAKRGRWMDVSPMLGAVLADPGIEVVAVDAALLARAVALHDARSDKRWGPTDFVSFVVMADRGIVDALACDRDFLQAGLRPLLVEKIS